MPTVKETFILSLTYEMSVDTETGEVLETKLIDRSVNKPVKAMKATANEAVQDDEKEPKLYLEDNKCRLNSKAVSLMGISPGDKLDIKYDDGKNGSIPIIGTDEAFGTKGGNKLTKSNTIACRGSKNEELSKYGKEFVLAVHPSKAGLFVLTSEEVAVDQLVGDDNVNIDTPEGIDLNLEGLVDDKDANVSSIDTNFFKL